MHRYSVRGAAVLLVVGLVVGGTAGAGWAKGKTVKPTIKSSLSSSSITLGNTAVDTVVLTGKAAKGSPTGSVTFYLCGPTSVATPCTVGNAGASAVVGLTTESMHRSTANVTINPTSTGWFCLLDQYGGGPHYKAVSDNDTATECLDVTSGGGGGQFTPTIKSSLSQSTITSSGSTVDTATVTGNATAGSPTGNIDFFLCGPTSVATACTTGNASVEAVVGLTSESGNRSAANITLQANGSTGWFCFLDQYTGDANYKSVSDNDTSTECVDITGGGGGGQFTPTIKSSLSQSTITSSGSTVDTATVTGNATAGSPTGNMDFFLCGPTSVATACTTGNASVEAVVGLTSESGNRSAANVTMQPNGSTGWFCFLDQYTGDANYMSVSDNDTSTECVDVTASGAGAQNGASATLTPAAHGDARSQASAPVLRGGSARRGPAVVLS